MKNLNKQKAANERRQNFIDKLDNFELAFKKFAELPPDKMIISHFRDREVCQQVLGYDGIFCDDFQIYREIRNYYQKNIITSKIKYIVPCDEIYNRLVYMGFASFDLAAMQSELQSKRHKIKMAERVKNGEPLKAKRDENKPIQVHIVGEPFNVYKFLKAYNAFLEQYEKFEEFKKNKTKNLTKDEFFNINKEYSRVNSAKFLGYPRSFSADLSNIRKAYFYGVSDNAEIDEVMKSEQVIKVLQDSGFDFSLRFADVEIPFDGEAYAEALLRYYERYNSANVPSTYNFADARRELNYCGNLGAEHILALAVLNGKVNNAQVKREINKNKVKEVYKTLGIKKQLVQELQNGADFNLKQFLNAFKQYRLKYKTTKVDSSFDRIRSEEEFGYPRSLFVDASMIFDAFHKKDVQDKTIQKVISTKANVEKLKTERFDFWPTGFTR